MVFKKLPSFEILGKCVEGNHDDDDDDDDDSFGFARAANNLEKK